MVARDITEESHIKSKQRRKRNTSQPLPAVPRSITGCGVSYIGEVSRSDGGVENITSFLLMGLKPISHQAVCIGYSTPSPYGYSPYLIYDEQRERIESITLTVFTPSELYGDSPPPLCFAWQNIGEVSRSDGGVENITSFLLMGLKPTSHQAVCIGYSTPSPCGHSPYIPYRNTGGEGVIHSV